MAFDLARQLRVRLSLTACIPSLGDVNGEAPPAPTLLDWTLSVQPSRLSAATNSETSASQAPVLLVTSQGGHLTQLLALHEWWSKRPRLWVAPPTPDVTDRLEGEQVVTSHHPTTRNLLNLVRNTDLAWRVVRRTRPLIVVSAGAGVALPFFVVAWMFRIPTVFIEVYDRFDSATMTGRLAGPFTTRRIIQWESQLVPYPDAHLIGPLL